MKKLNVSPEQHYVLQICKQQHLGENLVELLERYPNQIVELQATNLIHQIKGKPKASEYSKLRLTEKGKEVLRDLALFEVDPQAKIVFEKIKPKYLGKDPQRKIGKEATVLWLMTWFSKESGFTYPQIFWLLASYTKKESYTMIFEYIFFKQSERFFSKPTLNNSNLWNHYLQNKKSVESLWREKNVIEE